VNVEVKGMIIGLTGGIACGKSTVAAMLVARGAFLVDADAVAREVVEPGEPALEAIASAFGQAVKKADGTLDRKKLGAIVFEDRDKLRQLEAILHPAIRARMKARIDAYAQANPGKLAVADVPLLFETGQASAYEGVLVVYVPRAVQIERLMRRDGIDEEKAKQRIALQMDIEEKRKRATWVIDNSGTVEQTEQQVERFWRSLGMT
jgi:dephospho-CoA kinase